MTNDAATLVELTRHIKARPTTVWGIISDASRFSEWMAGAARFEPHPGSPFRIEFPQFQTVIRGEVLECDETALKLALSWGVEAGPQADTFPPGSSRLELSLFPDGNGTRVELRHSSLPSGTETRHQEAGWRFHCSRLDLMANRADLGNTLGPALDAWFAAWNETDPDARRALLESCCSEDVSFRDEWAEASGRDLLSVHIGNTQHFVPGWSIATAGAAVVCRGEALVRWAASGPEGRRTTGTNHVTVHPDGTITRVTGFAES